jgi:methylamine dehydrogenase heavy chain
MNRVRERTSRQSRGRAHRTRAALTRWSWRVALSVIAITAAAELPPEPVFNVARVAMPYAPHWAIVHDFAFNNLIDSKFSLIDADSQTFLGMLSAGQFATLDTSAARKELYVSETYYSHGSRGTRADLVTVYDMATLGVVAEIEVPPKRANTVVNKANASLTDDGRFLVVFNMNPATSVSVVDLEQRKFVGEIDTPGCSLVYATVGRGFFMLCGDGTLLAVTLDERGALKERVHSKPFIDIDADPLTEKSSRIGSNWYFPSFAGRVQTIAADHEVAQIGDTWWLTTEEERKSGWRPGGWHWTAAHPDGRLFVGMIPKGYVGSHKDPANEVWVFDVARHTRVGKIMLKTPAIAIEVTTDAEPRLLVANIDAGVDVYDANTGKYLHTVQGVGQTPYMIHRID